MRALSIGTTDWMPPSGPMTMLSSTRKPPIPWAATGMFQQGVICWLIRAASSDGVDLRDLRLARLVGAAGRRGRAPCLRACRVPGRAWASARRCAAGRRSRSPAAWGRAGRGGFSGLGSALATRPVSRAWARRGARAGLSGAGLAPRLGRLGGRRGRLDLLGSGGGTGLAPPPASGGGGGGGAVAARPWAAGGGGGFRRWLDLGQAEAAGRGRGLPGRQRRGLRAAAPSAPAARAAVGAAVRSRSRP